MRGDSEFRDLAVAQAMEKWNAKADQYNQWDMISGEEQQELIQAEMEERPQDHDIHTGAGG